MAVVPLSRYPSASVTRYSGYPAYGSSSLALDAADGVIDGRYYGAPIVGRGAYTVPYRGYVPRSSYVAPGVVPGSYYPRASSALAQDAADGVIDGKYYGAPIVGAGAYRGGYYPSASVTRYGGYPTAPTYTAYAPRSSALALDAADGMIDGRYYGAPIVGGGYRSVYPGASVTRYGGGAYRTAYPAASVTRYGRYGGAAYVPRSSALALDAADGVIDGKYYGAPIYGSGYRSGYYPGASVTRYAGRPAGYTTGYPAAASVTRYGGYPAAVNYCRPYGYRGNAALALDAADGVIDGKYYGARIV